MYSNIEYTYLKSSYMIYEVFVNNETLYYVLGLSDYLNSIHYRDSLRLFMNKIVDCLTIQIHTLWGNVIII